MPNTRATPGYKGEVTIDTSPMEGVDDVNHEFGTEEIESTSFGDTFEQVVSGLGNASMTISGMFVPGDTAQEALLDAAQPGDDPTVDVTYKPDAEGVLEFSFEARVDSVSIDQSVDDRVDFEAEVQLAKGELTITTA